MRGDMHYTLTAVDSVTTSTGAHPRCPLRPRYNIVPGQRAPVVIVDGGGRARVCDELRWGLLPRWRGHGGKRGPLVCSAPIEAVSAMPLIRDAFKQQRCLVIADGCFAWRELKQPIWFHPVPPRPIAFAGVWATGDDDQPSYAVLLGPPLVTRVNDPMPIVVPPELYGAWLDPLVKPDVAAELLGTGEPPSGWRADAVSTRMSSTVHDDPRCIEPLGNPDQGELF